MNYFYLFIAINLLIWSLWLWRYHIKPRFARGHLQQQLRSRPDYKQLILTENVLVTLFHPLSGHSISSEDRKRLPAEKDEDAFIYGEIQFLPFFSILEKAKAQSGDIFYDLGCGIGKAVFTAALYFDLAKACGIELLPGLYATAHAQIAKATSLLTAAPHHQRLAAVQFVHANFLNYNFSDADILFINATCLSYPTWEKLLAQFMLLKKGSRIIVTSKKIQQGPFELLHAGLEVMSWGVNSVNIYIKTA